jgi:ABC-type amino acid transport substrate-binding protein
MKKIGKILFIYVVFGICFANAIEIKVGIAKQVPFTFYNEKTKKYVGFNVDILSKIFSDFDFEYTFIPIDIEDLVPKLKGKKIDIIASYVPLNDKKFVYTEPYYSGGYGIFVVEGNNAITTFNDLMDKKVGVISDSEGNKIANNNTDKIGQIVEFNNYDGLFKALKANQIDATIDFIDTFNYFVESAKLNVKNVGEIINIQDMQFILNDKFLAKRIDKEIKVLKIKRWYHKIYEKWFNAIIDEDI